MQDSMQIGVRANVSEVEQLMKALEAMGNRLQATFDAIDRGVTKSVRSISRTAGGGIASGDEGYWGALGGAASFKGPSMVATGAVANLAKMLGQGRDYAEGLVAQVQQLTGRDAGWATNLLAAAVGPAQNAEQALRNVRAEVLALRQEFDRTAESVTNYGTRMRAYTNYRANAMLYPERTLAEDSQYQALKAQLTQEEAFSNDLGFLKLSLVGSGDPSGGFLEKLVGRNAAAVNARSLRVARGVAGSFGVLPTEAYKFGKEWINVAAGGAVDDPASWTKFTERLNAARHMGLIDASAAGLGEFMKKSKAVMGTGLAGWFHKLSGATTKWSGSIGVLSSAMGAFGARLGPFIGAMRNLSFAFALGMFSKQKIDTTFKLIGAAAGIAVISRLVGVIVDVTRRAMGLEETFIRIRRTSGEMWRDIGGMQNDMIGLSRTTTTSVEEVSSTVEGLVKAGLSYQAAIGGAATTTLMFARVAGVSSSEATNYLVNTSKQMKLTMGATADLITRAADLSTASVPEMADTFKAGAFTARSLGMDRYEFAALAAELANAGLKGTEAATSLQRMGIKLEEIRSGKMSSWQKKVIAKLGLGEELLALQRGEKDLLEFFGDLSRAGASVAEFAGLLDIFGQKAGTRLQDLFQIGEDGTTGFAKSVELMRKSVGLGVLTFLDLEKSGLRATQRVGESWGNMLLAFQQTGVWTSIMDAIDDWLTSGMIGTIRRITSQINVMLAAGAEHINDGEFNPVAKMWENFYAANQKQQLESAPGSMGELLGVTMQHLRNSINSAGSNYNMKDLLFAALMREVSGGEISFGKATDAEIARQTALGILPYGMAGSGQVPAQWALGSPIFQTALQHKLDPFGVPTNTDAFKQYDSAILAISQHILSKQNPDEAYAKVGDVFKGWMSAAGEGTLEYRQIEAFWERIVGVMEANGVFLKGNTGALGELTETMKPKATDYRSWNQGGPGRNPEGIRALDEGFEWATFDIVGSDGSVTKASEMMKYLYTAAPQPTLTDPGIGRFYDDVMSPIDPSKQHDFGLSLSQIRPQDLYGTLWAGDLGSGLQISSLAAGTIAAVETLKSLGVVQRPATVVFSGNIIVNAKTDDPQEMGRQLRDALHEEMKAAMEYSMDISAPRTEGVERNLARYGTLGPQPAE